MAKDKEDDDGAGAAGAKKKKMMMIGIVVAVLGAAGYFFMFSGSGDATAKPAPKEGEVVVADPIHINLADGHYLKLGLGLQVIEGPAHAPDPSKALDAAISLFSGREIAEMQDPAAVKEMKKKLVEKLDKAYHHDVMDVYFTEFVVQ